MSSIDDACALVRPGEPSLIQSTTGLIRWVCTKNPFYVLSALLMLVGLWMSFGAQARAEQTWALVIGLSGYTLLLAVPACLLVRYGGVWEDVRTVLLLVVLMFLATSVTFDETLARSPGLGICCYLGGWLFAVALSEVMLRAMRLVLPGWFRAAYHLFLTLFFLYPAALVPLLDQPRSEALQWALFGFSPAAAVVSLFLLPAIRRGHDYVRHNGSPWRWPLYPWSLFVFLGVAVAGRSFLLCWSMQHVERSDPEPLIFGPYFLVPLLLAVAVLLVELGLVDRRRGAIRAALVLPAGMIGLTLLGDRPDELYRHFLALFTTRLGGTPFFWTLIAAAGFYGYAWWRGARGATVGLTSVLVGLVVAGPTSRDLGSLVAPQPTALLLLSAMELLRGFVRRNSWHAFLGASCLVGAMAAGPGDTAFRVIAGYHLAIASLLILGVLFDDRAGWLFRAAGVGLELAAGLIVLTGQFDRPAFVTAGMVTAYVPVVSAILYGYGHFLRSRPVRLAAFAALLAWLISLGWESYESLRRVISGLDFIAGGLMLLAVAELISLAKAGILSRFLRAKRRISSPFD